MNLYTNSDYNVIRHTFESSSDNTGFTQSTPTKIIFFSGYTQGWNEHETLTYRKLNISNFKELTRVDERVVSQSNGNSVASQTDYDGNILNTTTTSVENDVTTERSWITLTIHLLKQLHKATTHRSLQKIIATVQVL